MKQRAFILLVFLAVGLPLLCPPASAQAAKTDAQPAGRLAVISSRDILTKCDRGVRVVAEIQRKFSAQRSKLGLLEQEVRGLQETLKASPENAQKTKQLQEKLQAYAVEEQRLLQEVSQEESLQFRPILELVNRVIEEFAKENNIFAIQERASFVYCNRALDMTEEIIRRVNLVK